MAVLGTLSVDRIYDISWNKLAFDRLVLEGKKKELIKALVTARVAADNTPEGRAEADEDYCRQTYAGLTSCHVLVVPFLIS
jgi:hypothetical protein